MDSDRNMLENQPATDEDDCGCYFLEPSSHPYNMTEKIRQANDDLFSCQPSPAQEKNCKVTFKEELISFEPDLTDEDVNSIESDQTEFPYVRPSSDANILYIEDIEEEVVEEVIEEINSEEDFPVDIIEKEIPKGAEQMEDYSVSISPGKISSRKKTVARRSFWNTREVHCKEHCIDRLDFALSMSINKLEIHEKEVLPPLQLLQRRCCDDVRKVPKTLPSYNGCRSEYGLTSRQLAKRAQQMENLQLKEQKRRELSEEYHRRRIQQNEEVFAEWLKEVSKRKADVEKMRKPARKQCYKPERPKTATGLMPKMQTKKPRRPHTTSSCIFIKVPQSILERGVNIGDLIITDSKSLTKRLHVLALS